MRENVSIYPGVHGAQDVVDIDEYSRTTKCCHMRLEEIWKDLELSSAVQEQTLQDITQKALGVWNGAVEQAEQHRNKVQGTIDEAASEARMIAEQLGDFTDMDDSSTSTASRLRSPGKTLKRRYDEVMGDLEVWKRKREARMREHDEIQAQVNEMRESLGQPVLSAKAMKGSITKSNIDFLKLELEKMRAEKVRRERTLESTLAKLRKICIELGVDDAEAAAEVHPSLRSFHQSMRGHYFSFLETKDKAVSESSDQQNIALSELVFKGLEDQLEHMATLKQERESRLADIREVLNNMWGMLDIPESDESRAFYHKMLESPARLHTHTLEKCQAEVTRLEAEQAKVMKVMIQAKSAEIARVCSETCLPVPDLGALVDNVESGQVAEVLSKLVRMVAEFTVIVERREPIMKAIKDIEEVFKEAHWHFLHKQDNSFSNRGRDANRVLQRVIKAEEKKKKLPKMIGKLHIQLEEWEASTGKPFALGHMEYKSDVLAVIENELKTMNEFRPKKIECAQPDPKKKDASGKSGRDPANNTQPVLANSAALAAMSSARDIKSKPADAPSDEPSTASGTSQAKCEGSKLPSVTMAPSCSTSVTVEEGSFADAPAVVTQTPSSAPAGNRELNPLQDLVNTLANTTADSGTDELGFVKKGTVPTQGDDSVNLGSEVAM